MHYLIAICEFKLKLYYFVWRKHENMSLCSGSRVNTNYERIASWGGWQCWTGDPRILETPLVAHLATRPWPIRQKTNLETGNSGQNHQFFGPCDLEIWQMTSKTNRAPFPCHFKLCASFHSHQRIRTFTTNDIHLQKTTMLIIDITSTQVRPILSEKLTIKSHGTFALDSYTRLLLIIHFISFEL